MNAFYYTRLYPVKLISQVNSYELTEVSTYLR